MLDKYDGLFKQFERRMHEKEKKIEEDVRDQINDIRTDLTKITQSYGDRFEEISHTYCTEETAQVRIDFSFNNLSDEVKRLENLIKTSTQNSTPETQAPANTMDDDVMENFYKKLYELDTRILECEQYSRRESVIISGIPNNVKHHDLENVTIEILKNIGIFVGTKDISAIHRLGKVSNNNKYPVRVIVRFVNRKIVDLCHERKSQLPELKRTMKMDIRFFESLAHLNLESVRLCNYLLENQQIHSFFLRNGFPKIVVKENDVPLRMVHPDLIRAKFNVPNSVKWVVIYSEIRIDNY